MHLFWGGGTENIGVRFTDQHLILLAVSAVLQMIQPARTSMRTPSPWKCEGNKAEGGTYTPAKDFSNALRNRKKNRPGSTVRTMPSRKGAMRSKCADSCKSANHSSGFSVNPACAVGTHLCRWND
jgi:hypothetical protein